MDPDLSAWSPSASEQRRIPKILSGACARTREMHLATRARRTERELQTDAFPDIDDLESTAHIFLAYDDFEATHTLGVARIVNLPVGGGSSSSSPHGPKPTVDRFFATTLSMIPDPVRFPVMVRTLLLEACHECVRRAGSTEFDLVTSAPNHVPTSAKPRTNEAPSVDVPDAYERCERARTYALRIPSHEDDRRERCGRGSRDGNEDGGEGVRCEAPGG